jgi:hypothetical protein
VSARPLLDIIMATQLFRNYCGAIKDAVITIDRGVLVLLPKLLIIYDSIYIQG